MFTVQISSDRAVICQILPVLRAHKSTKLYTIMTCLLNEYTEAIVGDVQ